MDFLTPTSAVSAQNDVMVATKSANNVENSLGKVQIMLKTRSEKCNIDTQV